MKYLIIAIVVLFSPPVFAGDYFDPGYIQQKMQNDFDNAQIRQEIENLREDQERHWREEAKRREQEREDRESERIRKQIEERYKDRQQKGRYYIDSEQ